MLERTDVVALARNAEQQCDALLATDVDVDVVLMVGVGAANAGELVVDGRGVAFVCLEHFTGVPNAETEGLGLDPELIPLWLAHEFAHVVRYTSPTSRSELRDVRRERRWRLLVLGDGPSRRRCASCSSTKGSPCTCRARSVPDTPRGNTSATNVVSTREFASSSRSLRAPSHRISIAPGLDFGSAISRAA